MAKEKVINNFNMFTNIPDNNDMPSKREFKFIDLFAGIGGFHLALHNCNAKCVFASEMDKYARETYQKNFSSKSPYLFNNGLFNSDIREMNIDDLPDFDILCAGFPCQPFSQAGLKKGFNDNFKGERGNLFFIILDILSSKKPSAFILENVQHLTKHDDGNTFDVIKKSIEELGYSFYYKILKASDFGLPQYRPRVYMVGFLNDLKKAFNFPQPRPLKYTMSDIFNGNCDKKIGYTIRVGGKSSGLNDRRNWDCYLVNNIERRIDVEEAKMMLGFPSDFDFPVSKTQSMKQLGNSIAIPVAEAVAQNVIKYLETEIVEDFPKSIPKKKKCYNKGEWSELVVILKLILEKKLCVYNSKLIEFKNKKFEIIKILGENDIAILLNNNEVFIYQNENILFKENTDKIINAETLNTLIDEIKNETGSTFEIKSLSINDSIFNFLKLKSNSNRKSDINVCLSNEDTPGHVESGFSIKSFFGSKPTLLNASSGTNFIFKISNDRSITDKEIEEINNIDTRSKIKDRLLLIEKLGGSLFFEKTEQNVMASNLNLIDTKMSKFIAIIILEYYKGGKNKLKDLIKTLATNEIFKDLKTTEFKVKKFLTAFALGAFPNKPWDGSEDSHGFIILKDDNNMGALHILYRNEIEEYLFNNTKLDTPSSSRHRFGLIYREKNELFIKLNLQIRFI